MKLPEKLTLEDIHEIAMNYRHDFGLTKTEEQHPFSSGLTENERKELVAQISLIYEATKPVLEKYLASYING